MRVANWALVAAFYVVGVLLCGALLMHGERLNGELGGAMGAAAVLFLMLPSFILWQDWCLAKADERARRALDRIIESFGSEMREMDRRHQEALRVLSIDYGAALNRAEAAEERLARFHQGPRAKSASAGTSIPRID